MPSRSYNDLLTALAKGQFPQSLYLHGAAEILKDEAVQRIVESALEPSFRDLNYEQRSAAELDPESLTTLLGTLPMFGDRRVVVLRAIEGLKKKPKVREALVAALTKPNPDTILILIQTAPPEDAKGKEKEPDAELARLAPPIECKDLDHAETVEWIGRRATGLGIAFAPAAADHLANAVDHNLSALKSELEKFSALGGERAITVEQVGEIVGIRHGETVLDWRDAVLEDNPARALKLLGPLLLQTGNSGVKLVNSLGLGLSGVWVARTRYEKGDRSSSLVSALFGFLKTARVFWGLGNWTAETQLWAKVAPRWSRARLRAALRATLAADEALKETRISDEQGVLTDLVLILAGHVAEQAGRQPSIAGRTTAGV